MFFVCGPEREVSRGPLPPFVGRRGLGKQCSMALFRQDPCDPTDPSESGIIRGSVPVELRGNCSELLTTSQVII